VNSFQAVFVMQAAENPSSLYVDPWPARAAADSPVVEARSDARRDFGKDGSRFPARGSDLARAGCAAM